MSWQATKSLSNARRKSFGPKREWEGCEFTMSNQDLLSRGPKRIHYKDGWGHRSKRSYHGISFQLAGHKLLLLQTQFPRFPTVCLEAHDRGWHVLSLATVSSMYLWPEVHSPRNMLDEEQATLRSLTVLAGRFLNKVVEFLPLARFTGTAPRWRDKRQEGSVFLSPSPLSPPHFTLFSVVHCYLVCSPGTSAIRIPGEL